MLPVVVSALRERRAGPSLVSEFLRQAKKQLQREALREFPQAGAFATRRERQTLEHCRELSERAHYAFERALAALDEYLQRQDERFLERSLLQYETAERYEAAIIRAKLHSPPESHGGLTLAS